MADPITDFLQYAADPSSAPKPAAPPPAAADDPIGSFLHAAADPVGGFVRAKAQAGADWSEVRPVLEQTGADPAKAEQQYRLDKRRAYESKRAETAQEFVATRALPFASAIGNTAREIRYKRVMDQVAAGQSPSDDDIEFAARHEHLAQFKAERQKTLGGLAFETVAGLPALIGESIVGGKASTAVLGAERVAQLGFAGRSALSAAQAPLMPSLYAEQAAQRATQQGGEPTDLKNLAPPLAMAALQNVVLGRLQTKAAKSTVPTAAGRAAYAGAIGVGEQAAVDTAAGAVDEVLPDAYKTRTRYGTVGDLARGDIGKASTHATVQALTFSAFAAMHGREANPAETIGPALDSLAKKGMSKEKAAEVVSDAVAGKVEPATPEVEKFVEEMKVASAPPGEFVPVKARGEGGEYFRGDGQFSKVPDEPAHLSSEPAAAEAMRVLGNDVVPVRPGEVNGKPALTSPDLGAHQGIDQTDAGAMDPAQVARFGLSEWLIHAADRNGRNYLVKKGENKVVGIDYAEAWHPDTFRDPNAPVGPGHSDAVTKFGKGRVDLPEDMIREAVAHGPELERLAAEGTKGLGPEKQAEAVALVRQKIAFLESRLGKPTTLSHLPTFEGLKSGEMPGPPAGEEHTVEVFRGVGAGRDPRGNSDTAGGLFYSPDQKVAQAYAGQGGTVVRDKVTFKNLLRADNWQEAKQKLGLPRETDMRGLIDAAGKAGFDGLAFKGAHGPEYIALKGHTSETATKPPAKAPVEPPKPTELPGTQENAINAPQRAPEPGVASGPSEPPIAPQRAPQREARALSAREQDILEQTAVDPRAGEKLAVKYGISRERVRQIKNEALTKQGKTLEEFNAEHQAAADAEAADRAIRYLEKQTERAPDGRVVALIQPSDLHGDPEVVSRKVKQKRDQWEKELERETKRFLKEVALARKQGADPEAVAAIARSVAQSAEAARAAGRPVGDRENAAPRPGGRPADPAEGAQGGVPQAVAPGGAGRGAGPVAPDGAGQSLPGRPGDAGAAPASRVEDAAAKMLADQFAHNQQPPLPEAMGAASAGFTKQLAADVQAQVKEAAVRWVRRVQDFAGQLAGQIAPRTSRLSEESGNAIARLGATQNHVHELTPFLLDKAFGDKGTLADRLLVKSTMDEFRLRYMRQKALAKGDAEAAADVISLVGRSFHDPKIPYPLPDEAAYQAALQHPLVRKVMAEHHPETGAVGRELEKAYRLNQGLEDSDPIHSETQVPGMVNPLVAKAEGEELTPTTVVVGGGRGNMAAQKLRRLGASRRATGASERGYELDYAVALEKTLRDRVPLGAKADLYRTLVKEAVAKWGKPNEPVGVDGQMWEKVPGVDPPRGTQEAEKGETALYVHPDAYQEVRQVLGNDQPPGAVPFSGVLAKATLASSVEAAYHSRNLLTMLTRPGMNPLKTIAHLRGLVTKNPETMRAVVDLARIGATKAEGFEAPVFLGRLNPIARLQAATGKFLTAVDRSIRLTASDAFDHLAEKGLVENTERAKRDFINQAGNYSKRTQNKTVAWLRDTGLGPFATAGSNYYMQGMRSLVGSHGLRSTSWKADVRLRAEMLLRSAVVPSVAFALNYALWGRGDGDDRTPLGGLKVGEKDGKSYYLDLGGLTGVTRGMRATGLMALAEGNRSGAKKAGSTPSDVFDKGLNDVALSMLHPAMGPPVAFVHTALTGRNTLGGQVAPRADLKKGESQAERNIWAAIWQTNPVLESWVAPLADEVMGFKPARKESTGEQVAKMFGPFGVKARGEAPGAPHRRVEIPVPASPQQKQEQAARRKK